MKDKPKKKPISLHPLDLKSPTNAPNATTRMFLRIIIEAGQMLWEVLLLHAHTMRNLESCKLLKQ